MADSWIKQYLQYTEKHESPEMFHFWNGIAMVSSVLGRRVWIDRGYYNVYPNPFIVLVAGSALCRKTTSINISTDFVNNINTVKVIDGKIGSVEKLYRELYHPVQDGEAPPAGLIKADELSVFLSRDQTGDKIMDFLIKAFDCPDKMEYKSVHGTNITIKNPCVVVLAGTQPDRIGKILPDMAVGGGFTSRILFPYADECPPERRRMWTELTAEEKRLHLVLAVRLREIATKFTGPFIVDEKTKAISEDWYKSIRKPEDRRLDGFVGRKHDHVWRTSIALRASQMEDNHIREQHFWMAVKAIENVERYLPFAFGDVGTNEVKNHSDRMIRQAHKAGLVGISHSDLLRKQYGYLNAIEFRAIMSTLLEQRYVVRGQEVGLSPTFYACNCDDCQNTREGLIKVASDPETK